MVLLRSCFRSFNSDACTPSRSGTSHASHTAVSGPAGGSSWYDASGNGPQQAQTRQCTLAHFHIVCATPQARAQSVNTILVGYYDIPSREEQPLKMVINPTGNEERSRQRYAESSLCVYTAFPFSFTSGTQVDVFENLCKNICS